MRYREAYSRGREILLQIHGTDPAGVREAETESRILLEFACGTSAQTLLMEPGRELTLQEEILFLQALERRLHREPAAYIMGEQEFMGLTFSVSPSVLIPRQDTEYLVEEALRELSDGARILDLCTGSGCVLLSLLHYSNGCSGVGTDISADALEIAEKNAEALGLSEQTQFVLGDLFAGIPAQKQFDLITANPPYIPTGVIDGLQPEVARMEPRKALDGGRDGLDFYRRIAAEAPAYLNIGGMLMLEIGYDQGPAVSGILTDRRYYQVEVYKDYGGNDRVVRAIRGTRTF